MRAAGFLLLISGWALVPTALGMLPSSGARSAFVLAGVAVEIAGLVLAIRAHMPQKNDRIPRSLAGENRAGAAR